MSDDAARRSPIDGLSSAEATDRVARGLTNAEGAPSSRSVTQILRSNVLTFFNALLVVMVLAILVFGQARDALFGIVLVLNMTIGIVQELRAKRVLDRLSVLAAPKARVVRDGVPVEVPIGGVVLDDVIDLRSGDQIVADGEFLSAEGLEIDESLLTGESRPVVKAVGDRAMSGSFCAAGSGRMRATAVGAGSYAHRISAEARRFRRIPSELRRATDRILQVTTLVMVPVSLLLIATRWPISHDLRVVVPETVGALVGMIPQGLVLLTSIAFAVSATKLARRQALVEELPSVELLARVDVVCLDKTGTLTEADLEVQGLELLGGCDEAVARDALGSIGCMDPPDARNATARSLVAAYGESGWACVSGVPFSSRRKWSAADFGDRGIWVFGAPDVLLPVWDPARERADELALAGARVVLLARASAMPTADEDPAGLKPLRARADRGDGSARMPRPLSSSSASRASRSRSSPVTRLPRSPRWRGVPGSRSSAIRWMQRLCRRVTPGSRPSWRRTTSSGG